MISVIIGASCLVTVFFLARKLLENDWLALVAVFLLGIDYNFLRTTRLGRMDILAMTFVYWSFWAYWKWLNGPDKKYFELMGLTLILGFFTHFVLGSIALLVILIHLFWREKNKLKLLKWKRLIPVGLLFLVLAGKWGFNVVGKVSVIGKTPKFLLGYLSFDFYSIKSIFRGDEYVKILFLVYFLSFLLLFLKSAKSEKIKFWLWQFGITFGLIGFVGSGWYLGFLALPTILCLLFMLKRRGTWRNFSIVLMGVFSLVNLVEQLRLNRYYGVYSYLEFGEKISEELPQGSKVFLMQLVPDPYFYLAENRQDLKLAYQQFHDYDKNHWNTVIEEADYVVVDERRLEEVEGEKVGEIEEGGVMFFIVARE